MKSIVDKNAIQMNETLEGYQNWLKTKGYREETLRGYENDVRQAMNFWSKFMNGPLFVSELGDVQVDALIQYLINERKLQPKTVNRKMVSLSNYFSYLKRQKVVSENPLDHYDRMKVTDKERTFLSKEEVEKIVEEIDHPTIQYFAMMMVNTGIRVQECINLTLSDVDLEEGFLNVINGKGGKNRTVPLNQQLQKELKEYLEKHRPYTKSLYFFALKKTGTVSEQYVNRKLKEATKRAGIDKHVTSHILRHSFASYLVKKNINIAVIQRLLGHQNIKTTSVYLHVQQDDLVDAVNHIDF
ncbi:tyrosine-type recombinase/integrase [Metabacillus fastidiosus]|uniref:tyrosine-type recombinase/integrase n=1 Tax=Metabacillus fastidiosus TaxID=1458 RepID=UPI003D2DC7F0